MNPVFQWVYGTPAQKTTAPPTTSTGISGRIEQAFDAASDTTGTSFQYLLDTAQRESSLQPDAKASTSSAAGLFQFVEGTWLQTLKEEGPSLGLGQYSAEITRTNGGRYQVADPAMREKILALREDPDVSSLVAGAFTRRNAESLRDDIGRDATAGELYIAHFLGAKGASSLIGAAGSDPTSSAADLFPQAARANPAIFYEGGRERTVAEVYANLTGKHGGSAPVAVDAGHVVARLDRPDEPVSTRWDPALGYTDAETGGGASRRIAEAESALTALTSTDGPASSGWTAAEPTDAFSAIYRTEAPATATAASAFWQGFSLLPNLFHTAVSDDASSLAATVSQAADTSAALRASQPGQILNRGFKASGPLDLARFLHDS
ncbi:lytic transglycosylase domain-containing protein [Pleomorphomonas sp. JP5]|uniref:lytic transglycosylase domain-containing protein n=1 Tax=Pleomorphomonas sp. JP5 TaxID=2942998 RepID=UPI002044B9FA|nr:lytic transglycosylase domain-containing protein [Pleomorphomonas sp. JP5]MCM5557777.1 lytic transglycosylase domain-containing protein [Pleomorphomonas sp. JP5]